MEAGSEQHGRPTSVLLLEVVGIITPVAHVVLRDVVNPFGDLLQLFVWVGLTLWVTRGRSRIARVIYTGLLLFGTAGVIGAYLLGWIPPNDLLMVVLQGVVILGTLLSLLWWPSTTTWLKAANERS